MDNEKIIKNWHLKIVSECEKRLCRKLTPEEDKFIRSRGSFIALEFIEDSVFDLTGEKLVSYLNSEN